MTIYIAASGTGGHILPAVYIAEAIRKISPEKEIEFIGAGRALEAKLIDARGFTRNIIPTSGVAGLGIFGIFKFLISIPRALNALGNLFQRSKPEVVVGIGGYVSVLPILYAWFNGIPTWIHEAEHEFGLANKFLSLFATKCSSAYPNLKSIRSSRVVYTGHPVRSDLRRVLEDRREINQPLRVLVLGGSQGAKALDESVPEALKDLSGISVRHQCREENIASVKSRYEQHGIEAKVENFIDDMTEAYLWSDLIISRAGAGLVMEISVTNRPVIFVPFPFAQGGHQLDNAKVLADAGKAVIVEEGDGFLNRLKVAVSEMFIPKQYQAMRNVRFEPRSLLAAEEIGRGVLGLATR